jgi:uncharacterized protein (DUF4415 family)
MNAKSTSTTFDDDAPITQADIDAGRLVLRQRVAGRVAPAKKRITLYLDTTLIEHFKQLAGERGYQTLINETLRASVRHEDIEATLRRVIREELSAPHESA